MKLAVISLCGLMAFVANSFAQESRARDLIGSWKSNRDLTVATIRVSPPMPPEKRARFEKLFGTMVITYTGSEMTAVFPAFEKYPERVTKEKYQIVAESEDRLLVRSKDARSGEEKTKAMNFVGKDRYWIDLDGFQNLTGKEYFDRVRSQEPNSEGSTKR